jgi:hypothetical protein
VQLRSTALGTTTDESRSSEDAAAGVTQERKTRDAMEIPARTSPC